MSGEKAKVLIATVTAGEFPGGTFAEFCAWSAAEGERMDGNWLNSAQRGSLGRCGS